MAAGGGINHPKSVCGKKQTKRKQTKQVKKAAARKAATKNRNTDSLTTSNILRKIRTNPSANIALSGKKKRLLLKQIKREEMEKQKMDQDVVIPEKSIIEAKSRKANNEKMDTT